MERPLTEERAKAAQAYFKKIILPEGPLNFKPDCVILDPEKFVDSHLQTIKHNWKDERYRVYFDRLMDFATWLEENYPTKKKKK